MIVCPGCRIVAEPGTYPSVSMASDEDSPVAVDWWCPACLAVNVDLAHRGYCRCVRCSRSGT